MNVNLAVLADYANVTREGKLNILGIFEIIFSQNFPYTHPEMQLIMSLESTIAEVGRTKKIEVQLMDEDGKKLFALGGEIVIGQVKSGELYHVNNMLVFNNLRFNSPGNYRFDIFIDNQPVKEVPLKVVKRTKPS